MGYRIISVFMIAFLVTGFSWGKKEEVSQETSTEKASAYSRTTGVAQSGVVTAAPAVVSSPDGKTFPTKLINTLATGDENERRARIESLKRLSKALSDMKSTEGTATPAPRAAVSATRSSSSTAPSETEEKRYPWGNY